MNGRLLATALRAQRRARDAAKLASPPISLDHFWKSVLRWNYNEIDSEETTRKLGLRQISAKYATKEDYTSTFTPLLLEELRSQLQQEKEEQNVKYMSLIIDKISSPNDFHILECKVADATRRPR